MKNKKEKYQNTHLFDKIKDYNPTDNAKDRTIKNMDDFVTQFVEDLEFDVLIGWADIFNIDHDCKSRLDDDYPDKESELRGQLIEAMNNIGKNKSHQQNKRKEFYKEVPGSSSAV